jgi:hypothetical protein
LRFSPDPQPRSAACSFISKRQIDHLRRVSGEPEKAPPAKVAEPRNISRRPICFTKELGVIFLRLSIRGYLAFGSRNIPQFPRSHEVCMKKWILAVTLAALPLSSATLAQFKDVLGGTWKSISFVSTTDKGAAT